MWYEILPTIVIITAFMALPHALSGPANWLLTGHYYRRSVLDKSEMMQYIRDKRLADPYKVLGLENIPDDGDEDDEKCEI